MRLLRAGALVSALTLAGQGLGYARTAAAAALLGAGGAADAFFVALRLLGLLRAAFAAGGVRPAFVPPLARRLAYRASRVLPALPAWLSGPGGLERAAERDALTPAAAAKLAAWALRTLGARRLLQALKDDPRAVGLVFRPLDPAGLPALGAAAAARLDRRHAACLAAVEAASEPLGEGLWLARASGCATVRRAPHGGGARPGGKFFFDSYQH